ncbi:MAG: putative zinc protease [Phycisphaerae bacterium]|nr:putative zinc protease [Phycisphaerae bacterium]
MNAGLTELDANYRQFSLACGAELAVDLLPRRGTVALVFRMLSGIADEPDELGGLAHIVETTLSKGTERFDGRALADAFDALGAQWSTASGRQSTMARVVCLPEFVLEVVDLVAEMIRRPTFPDDACQVAVELARQDLKSVEDDPAEVCRIMIQRLTLGPRFGRDTLGTPESLARIAPEAVRAHWRRTFHSGRLQIAAAGPIDADALAARVERGFAGLGDPRRAGRAAADYTFVPRREHREKDLKQQQIAITLPGARRDEPDYPVEQVMIAVLSGGMSGRLFTEVREKLGLVYWVSAWHEQPRGSGIIHVRASSTPERCDQTFRTLLREIERLGEDLTDEEVQRARNTLTSHMLTQDDLTRARAAALSEDLFYFERPMPPAEKLAAVERVTRGDVEAHARGLRPELACVATFGPAAVT